MAEQKSEPYLVLARKYRPKDFSDMIGQEPMVQTLGNAFATGRIHHAFILTGVRGVGKTTTARILARAFNYVGPDGAKPSLDLTVPGEHCEAIIEGRHVDVMEMDAASNTGIGDIREIIDSVKYGPVSAPYKVYIIDEVHMLSNQAFNGLLKTLEEPPPYVKFIFATTEIRKVPVTILSRCQRFDLRRISSDKLIAYLQELLNREQIEAEQEALSLIVRAGEGSARDCLSLLDQAIAHANGRVTAQAVSQMLGLADRSRLIDMFEDLMKGEIAQALDSLRGQYDLGADPETLMADLANFTHVLTRMKLVPAAEDDPSLTPEEKSRGADLANRLPIRVLTRTWQILQAGLDEISKSANAIQAAEMVLVRLVYAADLPTPDELIAKIQSDPSNYTISSALASGPAGGSGGGSTGSNTAQLMTGTTAMGGRSSPALAVSTPNPQPRAEQSQEDAPKVAAQILPDPRSFAELIVLASAKRDLLIKDALETGIRLVSFEPGRIEIGLNETVDRTIVQTLISRLKEWTGKLWIITVATQPVDAPTLREQADAEKKRVHDEAVDDPLVQAIFDKFPTAKLVNVRVLNKNIDAETLQNSETDEEE